MLISVPVLATVFEVDPSLANPDDLNRDELLATSARKQYAQDRTGPLALLPCSVCYLPLSKVMAGDTLAAIAARTGDLTCSSPEHMSIMQGRFTGDKTLGQIEYIFDLGNWSAYFQPDPSDGKKYASMLQMLQYPFSRGSIHIRAATSESTGTSSSPTASDKPIIDPGYYAGPHGELDLDMMTQCARFAHTISRTSPLSDIIRGPASPATCDDDSSLRDWVVKNTVTDWHPVGTCSMGGRGGIGAGVVDERLRVYGVNGLRVADASVMPLQISAHLQATVYAIAEKAAHMIVEDMGA